MTTDAIPTPEERPTLTVEEVAAYMRIARPSAYRAVAAGQIPSIRVGRRVLVPTAALRRLLGLDATTAAPSTSATDVLTDPTGDVTSRAICAER